MARGHRELRDRLSAGCDSAVRSLPVDAALLALTTRHGAQAMVHATDEAFRHLDEAQVAMGEGPTVEALGEGHPVLAEDLGSPAAGRRWPGFAPAARAAGFNAVFALPLRIGVIRMGVLAMGRHERGGLQDDQLAVALRLADTAAVAMLGLFTTGESGPVASPDGDGAADDLVPATVHQASGMIMVQLGVPIDEALARMRAYAFAENVLLSEVARAVVDRSLRLER